MRGVQKLASPLFRCVAGESLLHRSVATPLLVGTHGKRPFHSPHHIFQVEGVHAQSLMQFVRCSGHLGEHEDASASIVAGKVLFADEVHPVAQGRHEHDVTDGIEACQSIERKRSIVVVHRGPVHCGMLAVDEANQLVDLLLERPVRCNIFA